jgi:hypothetical protein
MVFWTEYNHAGYSLASIDFDCDNDAIQSQDGAGVNLSKPIGLLYIVLAICAAKVVTAAR